MTSTGGVTLGTGDIRPELSIATARAWTRSGYHGRAVTHRARITLAAISLLLCIVSAAACVASYVRPVGIEFEHHVRNSAGEASQFTATFLAFNGGRLYLHRLVFVRASSWIHISSHEGLSFGRKASERFTWTWLPYTSGSWQAAMLGSVTDSQWTLPLPLLVLLFAILPMRWAVLRRRERRRHAAKVCVRCGYDLRASSERCPECGEPIDPQAPPSKLPMRINVSESS